MKPSARGIVRRTSLLGVWALLWGGPAALAASGVDDDLSRVESGVDDLAGRSRTLAQQVAAGSGALGIERASERYQDAVYDFLLGRYVPAAESFFVLVRSEAMASVDLQWEAEWYLAESLFLAGHLDLAEDTYRAIVADPQHVFRPDAVRRLLEIFAGEDDPARFDALFASEILRGQVEPNDLIRYSVARAFHRKGDVLRSKSWFSEIQPGSPWYLRARYWMAAMMVEEGTEAGLAAALPLFGEISALDPVAAEDAEVRDLAWLAQARIFEHKGDFGAAVQAYGKVRDEGAKRADKLHELAWVYIEQGAYQLALSAVEDFLQAFPDHHWAADLRLVRGHLQFEQGAYDGALSTYTDVVDSYTPVKERFEAFAAPGRNTRDTVQEVLDAAQSVAAPAVDAASPDGDAPADGDATLTTVLPGWAVAIMMDDVVFARGLAAYTELLEQEADIVVSEAILADLEGALGGATATGSVDAARVAVVEGRLASQEQRLALLDAASRWLADAGGPGMASILSDLDAQRVSLGREVERLGAMTDRVAAALRPEGGGADVAALEAQTGDALDGLDERISALADAYRSQRAPAGLDPDMDPTSARIDRLHSTIARTSGELKRLGVAMGDLETDALENLRTLFRTEAVAVAEQRAELEASFAASERVTAWLLRQSFQRLSAVFGDSVLGADMGIVNVHWSRWVQTGAERKAVSEARSALLDELERAYGYVERQVQP